MHRFFSNQTSFEQETIPLSDLKEIHHLKNVLRLKPKQQIQIFNAQGQEIVGTIITITQNHIEIRRDYTIPPKKEKPVDLVLACALPKRAKFEFIIEKCTELGIDEIIPLKTARTEIILNNERAQKKKDRYTTVALNAAKQSGRGKLPKIHPVSSMTEALKIFRENTLMLIACLSGGKNIFTVLAGQNFEDIQRIVFFIGPEGDFTKEEINLSLEMGCLKVSLGSTVLKVDTAAISIVSCANFYLNHALDPV